MLDGVGSWQRSLVRWLPPGGAVGVAIGAALPWAASGRRHLSGYDLAGVARTFGLAGGGAMRWAVMAWLAVPFLAALAIALTALSARRVALVPAVCVSIAGTAVATWVVKEAPGSLYLGTVLTLMSALLGLAGLLIGVIRGIRAPRRI